MFICCTHLLLLEMSVCIHTYMLTCIPHLSVFLLSHVLGVHFSVLVLLLVCIFLHVQSNGCYPCTVLPYLPFFLCVSHLQPQWTSDGSGIVFVGWENSPRKLGIMYCSNRRLAITSLTSMLACMQYWRMSTILMCYEIRHDRIIISEPLLNHLAYSLCFCA